MHILLDENVPVDLARPLQGHEVQTVAGMGWQGVKNGELLRRTAEYFDVLVTMDRNLKYQQPLTRQPFGIVVIRAPSNRMLHLEPLVPAILAPFDGVRPGDCVMLANNLAIK